MSRLYIFINGINTSPLDKNSWNARAELWVEAKTPYKAEAFRYYSDTFFRRLWQDRHVDDVIEIINHFPGFEVVLVGHSNGCDIISRILLKTRCSFTEIHLIAGACDADCSKNGINDAFEEARIDRLYIYGSTNDGILKKAKWSTGFLRYVGLGYGYIGLVGPKKLRKDFRSKVTVNCNPLYDHSTWFALENFESTMRMITGVTS